MFDHFCFDDAGGCRLIGEIITYAGITAPTANVLACDGTSYLRDDYPDLYDVIGVAFGADDADHFNVPNLIGRVGVGNGSTDGLTPHAVGDFFGEETHVLEEGELAAHNHSDNGHQHGFQGMVVTPILMGELTPSTGGVATPLLTNYGYADISITGNSDPHNNMQPSLCLSYWIVAT